MTLTIHLASQEGRQFYWLPSSKQRLARFSIYFSMFHNFVSIFLLCRSKLEPPKHRQLLLFARSQHQQMSISVAHIPFRRLPLSQALVSSLLFVCLYLMTFGSHRGQFLLHGFLPVFASEQKRLKWTCRIDFQASRNDQLLIGC
ncbi:unnamed protein product [Albugo candida]|uniref:Uncharacterized protein n=1 Tax=Albugo candida TaxID=65357 RepID=A0A024G8J3_9STRA|nr:unnamed protein product [Albugo candida]|eukprot:CCI43073.1 unnamed protein product [Albugo candida]